MHATYYEVAPTSAKYHSASLLTYESSEVLSVGTVVNIKIRHQEYQAIVMRKVPKPNFKTASLVKTHLSLPVTNVKLLEWMREFYPSSVGSLAQLFYPKLMLENQQNIDRIAAKKSTLTDVKVDNILLTDDQKNVVENISNGAEQTFLLHGETGSGKTRVYIELAKQAISDNRSALILTPEISLTPQLLHTFKSTFGDSVLVLHSDQTVRERRETWHELLNNPQKNYIIIGPRSALFTPNTKLGVIVLDEFHDTAYKQDSSPYYSTIRTASKLAELHGAKLVLGSATPSINEYYLAKHKQIPILRMVTQASTPHSDKLRHTDNRIIDLTAPEETTPYPLLTKSLLEAIRVCLEKKEQCLLFLNKRGSARTILCQSCGWQSICPNCDLPLTYHEDRHSMQCHTCGFKTQSPTTCPECGSTEIIFKSPGTKSIVASLEKVFPEAVIGRFDRDNKKSERIEVRHQDIVSGKIDILVGTQLLIKGHDLPKLSLAAMLVTESSLSFPDYTAEERSYQMIRQLTGRVNRGHRKGTVILQTFNPSNDTLQEALLGNWDQFYTKQITERKSFGFPPFFHVMKIEVTRAKQSSAKLAIEKIAAQIAKSNPSLIIIGPSPSFMEKTANKWHWQCIVKAKRRPELVDVARNLQVNCTIDLDPSNLL